MTSDSHIQCAQHGEAPCAYVCEHLVSTPGQHWYCDYPTEDNPWPDAWCQKCDDEFQKEGEWNESNEGATSIKLICSHCYEKGIASSVDVLEQEVLDTWGQAIKECQDELCTKQSALGTEFSLNEHKRWDYDQATGLLTFSNDGVPAVYADIEMIGSISTVSETWLWGWANFHFLENVRSRIQLVRDYGERNGFPRLTVPKWSADEVSGWEVSAIAARVLKSKGVYRVPTAKGFLFMAISNIRYAT